MTKTIATTSQLRAQGRSAYPHGSNPYVRDEDTCAFENWDEGFVQAKYAAEWARKHETMQCEARS